MKNRQMTISDALSSNINVRIFFIFKKIGELEEGIKEKQCLFLETC